MADKKLTVDDLNTLYSDGDSVDSDLFAEARNNILMKAGDQYTRRGSKFWNRIRTNQHISGEWKIRLTKNHIHKITSTLQANITDYAPSVAVFPRNPGELSDKKAAELNNSVWQYLRSCHRLGEKTRQWVEDLVVLGECGAKIFFDPNAGKFVGYEPVMDENGQPSMVMDEESGQMKVEEDKMKPVFEGDIVFERILSFNLLRAPEAKNFAESPWVCYRKMVSVKEFKRIFAGDDDRQKMLEETQDETYTVFDSVSGSYKHTKNQCMLREFYFRPSPCYPKGYFYIATSKGILYEGELPFGIFPIVIQTWDEVQTTPRGRSIIKQLRPLQVEVNRCASKIAEAQMTMGDDKLLIQHGSKVSQGIALPGVRSIGYTGIQPIHLPGRSGEQYMATLKDTIAEMYSIANVTDPFSGAADKQPAGDPYAMLFASMRDKQKFSVYAEKFEDFLTGVCEKSLEVVKNYYEPGRIVPIIGKSEMINIEELKNTQDIEYQIKLEPQTDDMETKMGRQLAFNHILQYTGQNLSREDLGKLIRHMPFANIEGMFDDLTIDYDNATNDILAMDRGKPRPAKPNDNHDYMVKRLTQRMKSADFEYLPPQIQMLYQQKIQEHEQFLQKQTQDAEAAAAGFIPTGGYAVKADLYVTDAQGKTKRATVPYESMQWLIDKLAAQGSTQEMLDNLPPSAVSQMVDSGGMQPQGGVPQGPGAQGRPPIPMGKLA